VTGTARAHAVILAATLAVGLLIGLQLGRGALDQGALALPDPCAREVALPGDSVEARAQRIALRGLDHAACRLGTSREALLEEVIVVVREGGSLPPETEERIKGGLRAGIDAEQDEGGINAITAFTLSQAVRFAPFDWLVETLRRLEPVITS
jgi:hypothetical protein